MSHAAGSLWFNRSFNADTHRQCAALRRLFHTPCCALSVRAGQRRRYLQAELAKEFTQSELLDLGAKNSDAAAIGASRRLQELRLNWLFVVQAAKPPGTARLDSSAEREVATRTAQILRDKAPEVSADVRSAFIYLDAPLFTSYQRAVGQAFMNSAGRLDPSPQGSFAAFMRGWH